MKKGYIGKGNKIHYIVPRFKFFFLGEKSLCGKKGKVLLTNPHATEVDCKLCKRCSEAIPDKKSGESETRQSLAKGKGKTFQSGEDAVEFLKK